MSFYYLIDFENVREMGISSLPPTESCDHIYVFYTDNASKLNMDAMLGHDAELKFIKVAAGKQSLDMHLVSVLGFLLRDQGGENEYIVVSRDNGFDNVINFWKSKGFLVGRHMANPPVAEPEEKVEKPEEKKKPKRTRKNSSEKKNGSRRRERNSEERTVDVAETAEPADIMPEPVEVTEAEEPVVEEVTAEAGTKTEEAAEETVEEVITEETAVEEVIAEETADEEEPVAEKPVEEVVTEETEEEESPAEEPTTEESAVEESKTEEVLAEETIAEESAVEETAAEENKTEEPAAEKEQKREIDPHTQMNNKLMALLRGKLDANTLGAIASIVIRNMDVKNYKQVIYRAMVKKFGQKQGLEYYSMIKKDI